MILNARAEKEKEQMEAKRKYNHDRYWNTHIATERENSVKCKICGGWVSFNNQRRHNETSKHLRAKNKPK
jgi:hypothetical protein